MTNFVVTNWGPISVNFLSVSLCSLRRAKFSEITGPRGVFQWQDSGLHWIEKTSRPKISSIAANNIDFGDWELQRLKSVCVQHKCLEWQSALDAYISRSAHPTSQLTCPLYDDGVNLLIVCLLYIHWRFFPLFFLSFFLDFPGNGLSSILLTD